MRILPFIKSLIGTAKVVVEDMYPDTTENALVIKVHPIKVEQCRCGICHRKAKFCDVGRGQRRWRTMDVGSIKTYVEADSPRVRCKEHGVVTAAVPWARHASRFTMNFEETIAWLSVHASKNVVSELFRIHWRTVGEICGRVYNDIKREKPSPFNNLETIGIDETSYKKGQKYMTVVINHDTGTVIWCHVGHGKEILSMFFELLTEEQRGNIRCVSADGASWIATCVANYCPNAELCIDPFHVVSWATDALDKLRRQEYAKINKEAKKETKDQPKGKRGRPRKGEEKKGSPKKEEAKQLKSSRYALLKNPENLTENQQSKLESLIHGAPRLYRGYRLKEGLRMALHAGPDMIEQDLDRWMAWAQRCRIPEMRELRTKIKNHYDGIVAAAHLGINNARMEATNNVITLLIRKAFGFRNTDNMIAMIMLSCSDCRPNLPGRATA